MRSIAPRKAPLCIQFGIVTCPCSVTSTASSTVLTNPRRPSTRRNPVLPVSTITGTPRSSAWRTAAVSINVAAPQRRLFSETATSEIPITPSAVTSTSPACPMISLVSASHASTRQRGCCCVHALTLSFPGIEPHSRGNSAQQAERPSLVSTSSLTILIITPRTVLSSTTLRSGPPRHQMQHRGGVCT